MGGLSRDLGDILAEVKLFFSVTSRPSTTLTSASTLIPTSSTAQVLPSPPPPPLLSPPPPPSPPQPGRRSTRSTSKASLPDSSSIAPTLPHPPQPHVLPPSAPSPSWLEEGLGPLLCSLLDTVAAPDGKDEFKHDTLNASSLQAANILHQFLVPHHISKLPNIATVLSSDEFFRSYTAFVRALPFLSYNRVNLLRGLLPSTTISQSSLTIFAHPFASSAKSGLLSALTARALYATEHEARLQGWASLTEFIKLSSSKKSDEGISRLFVPEDVPALLGILAIAFSATDGRASYSSFSSSSSTSSEPYVRGAQDIAEQICSMGKYSRTSISSVVSGSFTNVAVSQAEPVDLISGGRNVRFSELLSRPQRHWLACVCIHYLQRRSQHISGQSVTDILSQERRLVSTRNAFTFLLDALELEDEECSECDDTPDNVSVDSVSEPSNPILRRPIFQALMTAGLEVVFGLEVYLDVIGKVQSDVAIPIHARLLGHLFDILEKLQIFSHIPIHAVAVMNDNVFSPLSTSSKSSSSLNPLTTSVSIDESGLAPKIQPWSIICKTDNVSGDLRSALSSPPSSQSTSQASTSSDVSIHSRINLIQRKLYDVYSPSIMTIQSMYVRFPSSLPKSQASITSQEISQFRKKTKLASKTVDVIDLMDESPESVSEDVSMSGRKRGRSKNASTEPSSSNVLREVNSTHVFSEQELRPRISLPDAPLIFASHSTPAQGALAFLRVISDAVVVGSERIASAAAAPQTSNGTTNNSVHMASASGMSPANVMAQKRFRECMAQVQTVNDVMLRVPDVFIVSDEFVARARNWGNLTKAMAKTTVSLFCDKRLPIEISLFDPSAFFRTGQIIATTMKLLQEYSLFAPTRVLTPVLKEISRREGSISEQSKPTNDSSMDGKSKIVDDEDAVMNIGSSVYSMDSILLSCTRAVPPQIADVPSVPPIDVRVELKHHLLLSSVKSSISCIPSLSPSVYSIEGALDVSTLRPLARMTSSLPKSGSAPFIKGPLSRLRLPSPWQPVFPVLEARLSPASLREMQVGTYSGRQRPILSALIQGASGVWSQEFVRFYLKRRSLESSIDLCFRALSIVTWPLEIPINDSVSLESQEYANLARSSIKTLLHRWGFDDAIVALSGNRHSDIPSLVRSRSNESRGEESTSNVDSELRQKRVGGDAEDDELIDDDDAIDEDNDDVDEDDEDDDELRLDQERGEVDPHAHTGSRVSAPFSTDKIRIDISTSAKNVLEVLGNAGIHVLSVERNIASTASPSSFSSASQIDAGAPSLELIIRTLNETVVAAKSVVDPDQYLPPASFAVMVSALVHRLVSIDPSVTLSLHEFFGNQDAPGSLLSVLGIKSLSQVFLEILAPLFFTDSTRMKVHPSNIDARESVNDMLALRRLLSLLHSVVAESAQKLPLMILDREHVILPSTPVRSAFLENEGELSFAAQNLDGSRNHRRVFNNRFLPENIIDAHSLKDDSMLRFPISYPKTRSSASGPKSGVMLSLPSGTKALLERPSDDTGRKVSIDSLDLVVHVAGFSNSKSDAISFVAGEKRLRVLSDLEQPRVSESKKTSLNANSEHHLESEIDIKSSPESTSASVSAGAYDSNYFGSLLVPPALPYGSVEEVILNKIPPDAVSSFLISSPGFISWANSIVNRQISLHPWHIRSLPLKPEQDKALTLHPHPLVRRLCPLGTIIFCDICGDTLAVRHNCEICGYDECLPCHRKRFPDLPSLVHRKIDLSTSSIETPTLQEIDAAVDLFRSKGLAGDRLFEAVSSNTRLLNVVSQRDEEDDNSQHANGGFDDVEQDDFGDLLDREHAASGGGGAEYFARTSKRRHLGGRKHISSSEKSSRPAPRLVGGAPVPFQARIVSFDALTCSHRVHFPSNSHEEDVILPLCHYALLPQDLPFEGPASDFLFSEDVLSPNYQQNYMGAASIEDTASSSLDDDIPQNVDAADSANVEFEAREVEQSNSLSSISKSETPQTSPIAPVIDPSAPAVRAPLPKDWSCDACTFINPFAAGVCGICGTGQPSSIRILKDEQSGSASSSKQPPSSDPTEISWECPRCTVRSVIVRKFPGGPRNVFAESLLKLAVVDVCTMCQSPIPHEVISDAINKLRIAAGLPPGGPSEGFMSSSASASAHRTSAPILTPGSRLRQHYTKTMHSLLTHLDGLVQSIKSRSSAEIFATGNFIEILHELPPHLIRNQGGDGASTTSVEIGSFSAKLGDTIDAVGATGRWLEAIIIAFGRLADDNKNEPASGYAAGHEEKITHILVRYKSWDTEHDRWLPIEFVSLPGRRPTRLVAAAGINTRDWRYEIITRRENHFVELLHKGRWVVARVVSIDGVDFSFSRPAIAKLFPRIHVNVTYQIITSGVTGEKSARVKITDENLAPLGTHLPWPLISSKSASHLSKFSYSSWKNIQDPIREQISKCGIGPALGFCADLGSLKAVSFLNLRSRPSTGSSYERMEPFRKVIVAADDENARIVLSILNVSKNPSSDYGESKRFLLALKSGAMQLGCTAYDFAACVSRSALQCFYNCLSHSALIMELERKHPLAFPKGQATRLRNFQPALPNSYSTHVTWSNGPLRMATHWDEGRASFAYDRSAERPPKPRELKASQLFERALGVASTAKRFFSEKSNDESVFHIRLRLRIFGCDDSTAWNLVPSDKPILAALQDASCRLLIKSGLSLSLSSEVARELAGAFLQESVTGNRKKTLPVRLSDGKVIPVSAEAAFCTGMHVQMEPVLVRESSRLHTVVSPLVEARNAENDILSCGGGFNMMSNLSRSSFETLMSGQAIDALKLLSKLRGEIFSLNGVRQSCNLLEVEKFGKSLISGSNSLLSPRSAVDNLFVSSALTLMSEIQIADTLASSVSILPKWLTELVNSFPLSLPASLRHVLLSQVAFGPVNVANQVQEQVLLVHELARAGRAGAREIRYDDFGRPQQNEVVVKVLPSFEHVQAYRLVALRGRDAELLTETRYGREHSPRGSQITHSPLGIIYRDRAEIQRADILAEASQMLLLHSKGSGKGSILNINFFGEKGSGEGPTRDFFSSVADELQKRSVDGLSDNEERNSTHCRINIFYHDGSDLETHVHHPFGLFPLPIELTQRGQKSSVNDVISQQFSLMGRCIGKAIKDSHIFPLPLSTQFFALLQRFSFKERVLPSSSSDGIHLLHDILTDPVLASVITEFLPALTEVLKIARYRLHLRETQNLTSIDSDTIHHPDVSSFMLDFRDPRTDADLSRIPLIHCGVPGAPSLSEALMLEKRILCASGINDELTSNSNVTFDNVDVYMAKLIAFTSWYGIRLHLFSLVLGLKDVLSNVSLLGGLLPSEIRDLACGSPSVEWTLTDLQANIKLQPGQYSMSSQPAQFFFTTLLDMNQSERQDFLRFVTGCPLLPIGGLAALNPPLTLMQKGLDSIFMRTSSNSSRNIDLSGDLSPPVPSSSSSQCSSLFDKVLVSSSTCFHQIKLPPYSSLEITKQMLRNSIVLSKGLIDMS